MPKPKHGLASLKPTKTSGVPKVAVIVTVYNEAESIEKLLHSLQHQTLVPQEVVVVDGGSSDATLSILKNYSLKWSRLKVYQSKGNRSIGRNLGVAKSTAPIILFTDAGCYPESDWVEKISAPFEDTSVQVVSGYYRGVAENNFQKCLIPYVLVMPDKAPEAEFFPSTRSMALRRYVWNKSGGFDIRLSHNEDYAYAHWLKRMGYHFTFAPNAIVNWLPRKNLTAAFWMFLRFALGDIQSGIFRPQVKRLLVRFLVLVYLVSLSIEAPIVIFLVLLLLAAYYLWSIRKNYRYVRNIHALYWLPIIQITADVAVLMGTVMGIFTKV